jgi:hypothetical protein
MTARSIRRAAERKAKKLARKAERQAGTLDVAVAASPQAPSFGPPSVTEPRASASVTAAALAISEAANNPASQEFSRITPAQLAANRANAQLSSNAVKSGLTGRTVLLPSADVDEYAAFLAAFQHDLAPVGQTECELVQSIADCHWRLRRIRALEFALYAHGHSQFEEMFADQPEEVRYNMILLQTDMTYQKQFRNYQIQEARLHRRRDKDMAELLRLQAERKSNQEQEQEEDFSDLDALFAPPRRELTGQTRNGFEFSTAPQTNAEAACQPAEHPFTGEKAA